MPAHAVADPAARRHIVVDGRELTGRPTGVGRYLLGILREWARAGTPHRITVIIPGPVPADVAALAPVIGVHPLPAQPLGTWFEQMVLPGVMRALRPDVVLAPAYTAPLRLPAPLVLVVHDVSFFAHPEWFGPREGWRRRLLTRLSARRAAIVATVSQFSASEITRYLGVPASRIRITPNAAPPLAHAHDRGPAQPPTVLYVGTLLERRHIEELIAGFALAASRVPAARFVLAGDDRNVPPFDIPALARQHGVEGRVEWRRYVSDAELASLYAAAHVFTFVSEYEGFAITPMEALAAGVPCVLQDTAVAREIYDGAALFVAPTPDAIGGAITTLLTDPGAGAALVAAGQARLSRYSWADSAARLLEALLDAVPAVPPRGARTGRR
jgi:glycosyltransferase involved in cell wall biosynthesis